MTHFQREYSKRKERYQPSIPSSATSFIQKPNPSVTSNSYPNKSEAYSGKGSTMRRSQNVGKFVQRSDKKSTESKDLRVKAKNRTIQIKKNAQLNMMRLQDKQFELKGNIINISVGQIIDREAYLQNLDNQLTQLKSKIQTLQFEQKGKGMFQAQQREKSLRSDDPSLERSRTIQARKNNCGRIYTRLKTPSSDRSAQFRVKDAQTSSYYKWRPRVDQNNLFEEQKLHSPNIIQDKTPIIPSTSQGRRKKSSDIQKPSPSYRLKQKNISKATITQIDRQDENIKNFQKPGPKKRQNENIKAEKNQLNPELNQNKIKLEPYSGTVFLKQSVAEWEITKIQDNFRQKIINKLQIPKGFPLKPPEIGMTFQEYEKLGPKVFQLFGVKADRQQKKIITRKFKNGLYYQLDNGKNIIWYYSGTFYFGDWQVDLPSQSQKNGFGFQYVPNKYIYLGYFKDGMRHGKGTIQIFANNTITPDDFMGYDGQWACGKPNGFGRHIDQKNNKYIGDFKDGQKTGKAIILSKEGLYYQGEVKKNLKHGLGFQKVINNDTYTGQFADGKFNGFGTYKWTNGSVYEGYFVNGKRQGKGNWKGPNGDQFSGEYFEDIKNGWGKFTWANGQIYQGQFRHDLRHGEGTYKHPNGKIGKFWWVDGQIDHRLYSKEEEQYRCRNLKQPEPPTIE